MKVRKTALMALLALFVAGGAWAVAMARDVRTDSFVEPLTSWMRTRLSERIAFQVAPEVKPSFRVNGSQPRVPPGLVVAGEITGVPAAFSTPLVVTVYAGSRSFPAVVQGITYQATVNELPSNDMVRVVATSSRIKYVSVLGSYDKLKQVAGADRRLDLAEHYRLRVSPWSTSLAWMTHVALGRDALSDLEFEKTTRSIEYADMANAANVLFLVAYDLMTLPTGFNDGWQLLGNEAAYKAALEGHISTRPDPEIFGQQSLGVFFDQPDHAKFGSLSQLPEATLFMGAVPMADVPVSVLNISTNPVHSDAQMLVKNSDATVSLYSGQGGRMVRFEAEVSHEAETDGEISLTPLDAVPVESMRTTWFSPDFPVRTISQVQHVRLRRLFVGDNFNIWATSSLLHTSYPDNLSVSPEDVSEQRFWSVSDLDQQYSRSAWAGLSGKRGLPWICDSSAKLVACEYAQYRFDGAGTGVVEDLGLKLDSNFQPVPGNSQDALSWSVDGVGRLQVRVRDSDITFWTLPGGNTAADSVVYLAHGRTPATTGQALFGQTLSLRVEPFVYGNAEAIGKWSSGVTAVGPVRYPDPKASTFLERKSDATTQNDYVEYGQILDSYPGKWQLFSQRTYDSRALAYFGTDFKWVMDCETAFAAGATHCASRRMRYFKPLKRVGGRIYGIEEFYGSQSHPRFPGDTSPYLVSRSASRPGFHDCVSTTCMQAPVAAVPARRSISDFGSFPGFRSHFSRSDRRVR